MARSNAGRRVRHVEARKEGLSLALRKLSACAIACMTSFSAVAASFPAQAARAWSVSALKADAVSPSF
jgi:hypothetical protein